jgi:hypothetical protein
MTNVWGIHGGRTGDADSLFLEKNYIADPDAATIFSACGLRFVAVRRRNMAPNSWADEYDLRLYRKCIETLYSQLEAMGLQRLHVRTNHGLDLKTCASLLALAFTNILNV